MHGLLISMLAGCLLGPQDRAAWDDKWGVQDGGQDLDGDGYGTTDCDDGNDAVFPGAEDPWYDGVDADCGGNDDYDQDRDGYVPEEFVGLPTLSVAGSGGLPGGDCDDTDGDRSPGADELCNEEDDDCDEQVDEDAVDAATWHPDCDEDGFGDDDADFGVVACEPPEGACPYLDDNSDCDDGDVEVHPDATEMCNEIDDDCNDAVDENSAADAPTWYPDLDGDSHGDDERSSTQCDPPALTGYIEEGGDCDDGDPDVHEDATEVCNEIDDDCDDEVDEADADDASTWYADVDGDGYGDAEVEIVACWLPDGAAESADDCNDGDDEVNPGVEEVCQDGVDNNCDGGGAPCEMADMSLADADVTLLGPGDNSITGYSVAGGGDVNGDGLDDLLISDRGAGGAIIVHGTSDPSGLETVHADVIISGANLSAATFAGDVDGDGLEDILTSSDGAASLLLGADALVDTSLTDAIAHYTASEVLNGVGTGAAAAAGDVNGDGFSDMLLGAWRDSSTFDMAGAAYLLLGSSSPPSLDLDEAEVKFTGVEPQDYAGVSVAAAGDVNADGLDDILIGAHGAVFGGAAYLILGDGAPAGMSLEHADTRFTSELSYGNLGQSLCTAGDLDGDGYDDILVADPNESTGSGYYGVEGTVYVVLGPIDAPSIDLDTEHDARFDGGDGSGAGSSVAPAGDVDDDGYPDLLISGYQPAGSYRKVYLVLGNGTPTSMELEAEAIILASSESYYWQSSISAAKGGNFDGDGFSDILIGEYGYNSETDERGAAYLIRGNSP